MGVPASTQENAFALQDSRESTVRWVSTDLGVLDGLGGGVGGLLKNCLVPAFATEA